MALRADTDVITPPPPPETVKKTVTTSLPKKMGIIPVKGITPLPPSPPKPFIPPPPGIIIPPKKGAVIPASKTVIPIIGPGNPYTTGLGSQVKSDTEVSSFGATGSEGVSGLGTGVEGNGAGVLSSVPNYIWIGAVLVLGYFLMK